MLDILLLKMSVTSVTFCLPISVAFFGDGDLDGIGAITFMAGLSHLGGKSG